MDLFAGAGGLSLGAEMAGINVQYAIENDFYAAKTYQKNHVHTQMICDDIRNVDAKQFESGDSLRILFGGPPCQGFSSANQKTRNQQNPQNWLFQEFMRFAENIAPDWVVMENVKGIVDIEQGLFSDLIEHEFCRLGYKCSRLVLSAYDYGVPQLRSRVFFIGSKNGYQVQSPEKASYHVNVGQAIRDLPHLNNGANIDQLSYSRRKPSLYAQKLRGDCYSCKGHLVTKSAEHILRRYAQVPQGGNWKNIPDELMMNYKDRTRCHTDIYKRLRADSPAVTVGNYRKSMLIHPWENRGLSVREAARLQSFPDTYDFCGSIGFQQQQVGNAVPPYLSQAVFSAILKVEGLRNG